MVHYCQLVASPHRCTQTVDNVLNTDSGIYEDMTISSISFDIYLLLKVKFDLIYPSDTFNTFKHNMKFLKTVGLKLVDRISDYYVKGEGACVNRFAILHI